MMETAYPESPLDFDDAAYPCKGCGEILEEGKAFELAGNRWHIDCFRCNTCGTLLDSDANLLLLGDGSLICNNCTYSCSSCGNKIEDLAILTGDQAFCANCFKCRNCKRQIENLRYARTSQGIFCMDCHEALMARRRKKSARGASGTKKHTHLDKSLPSLPPPGATKQSYESGADTLWPDTYPGDAAREIPSVSRTVSELQADGETEVSRSTLSIQNNHQPSPNPMSTSTSTSLSKEPEGANGVGLTLPSTTYRNNRQSYQSARSTEAVPAGNEEYLIPLAFDPTPVQETPALSNHGTPHVQEDRPAEYFPRTSSQAQSRTSATQVSTSHPTSPHIAFQERARQSSHDHSTDHSAAPAEELPAGPSESLGRPPFLPERNRQRSAESSTVLHAPPRGESSPRDSFKLQEAPKSRGEVKHEGSTPRPESGEASRTPLLHDRALIPDASALVVNGSAESPRQGFGASPHTLHNIPKRGDSLESAAVGNKRLIPRKELNANASVSGPLGDYTKESSPSILVAELPGDFGRPSSDKIISAPITSPASQSLLDTANTPQHRGDVEEGGAQQPFVEPRAAPQPPFDLTRPRTDSLTNLLSDSSKVNDQQQKSPKLPRWSGGGDFTLDEDMARILGGDELAAHESFLRRVSNSVRHGRSYSDKSGRTSRDRWPRSPVASTPAGQDIGSPNSTSPDQRDEISWYKSELRREKEKSVDREKRIAELEAQFESSANIKQANSELREKRSTIVVLDSQREMVVRELETLSEHIARARASTEPVDFAKLSSAVLRDFAESLEKLRNSFAPQIEESIQRRNELLAEITQLGTMKDKSFQEFEQLSSKNAQLAELNNQLVHQIQDIYKANSGLAPEQTRSPAPNGLGIYSHHKDRSQISIDSRDLKSSQTEVSVADSSTTLQGDAESIQVIGGPNVVSIKKMQPKKFDWRKGQKVAKGMAKGVKGAFTSTQQSYNRDLQFAETGAYGQLASTHEQAAAAHRAANDPQKQGFGFFGNQKNTGVRGNGTYATGLGSTGGPSTTPDPATHLFGSDLEQRADYEKTTVPAIVKRCVEEVESRGMDQEGIYRKSGGNSQVQQVKDSFEQPGGDFNISDPDLDIHAVTSCLKQYFRRLPAPLITYEVYDRLLEATSVPDGPSQSAQRLDAISDALHELPRIHYQTLEYLIRHLRRVVSQEKENLMTPLNIAVVFAPTIMRPESVSRELTDTRAKNEVVMWMVENVDRVFAT